MLVSGIQFLRLSLFFLATLALVSVQTRVALPKTHGIPTDNGAPLVTARMGRVMGPRANAQPTAQGFRHRPQG